MAKQQGKKQDNVWVTLQEERGAAPVKSIAVTVAVIVIIGLAITAIESLMPGWIEEVWDMLVDQIKGLMS